MLKVNADFYLTVEVRVYGPDDVELLVEGQKIPAEETNGAIARILYDCALAKAIGALQKPFKITSRHSD